MKILLVDDTQTERLLMTAYLEEIGHQVVVGQNGRDAITLYHREQPDLIIMDVIMPELNGHEAAREIRRDSTDWIPIIFLSGRVNPEDIAAGIEAGGDDYLAKPVDIIVLEAKMKAMQRIAAMRHRLIKVSSELEKVNSELVKQVNVDGLTGLSNRRYMDKFLKVEIARSIRSKQVLTVMLADVDHFKSFNDYYGHLKGDDCLKKISTVLSQTCKRATDMVARYGGEEFAIILPDTPAEAAMMMAEALRSAVMDLQIPHEASATEGVCTISLGVYTSQPQQGTTIEQLLQAADQGLYHAKEAGRNQVKAGGD